MVGICVSQEYYLLITQAFMLLRNVLHFKANTLDGIENRTTLDRSLYIQDPIPDYPCITVETTFFRTIQIYFPNERTLATDEQKDRQTDDNCNLVV